MMRTMTKILQVKTIQRTPICIIKAKPGPKGDGNLADMSLKKFELFFNNILIEEVIKWTNQKIQTVKVKYKAQSGYLYGTSIDEIQALLGILLFLDARKSGKESTASLWKKDGTGRPICIAVMSQKRFLFLLYCLHFDNSTTQNQRQEADKLAVISKIYNQFVLACEANYSPGVGCTVDKSLLGFKGRCDFKQYIPNKPTKYGTKVYVMGDSKDI